MSSNPVAKVERFACTIPHEEGIASWLLPVVVVVVVAVAVAVVVAVKWRWQWWWW